MEVKAGEDVGREGQRAYWIVWGCRRGGYQYLEARRSGKVNEVGGERAYFMQNFLPYVICPVRCYGLYE